MSKKIVIKLGGSLFSESDEKLIDFEYLSRLRTLLEKFIPEGMQFILAVGGGFLTRKYQKMLSDQKHVSNENLDWIGIATINLNAEIIKSFFADIAEPHVVRYTDYNYIEKLEFTKPLIICAAKEPGHSSDMESVYAAKLSNSKEVYRLTNVDAIYSANPRENPDAKKFDKLSWDEYFNILGGKEFTPGAHFPIDPVASRKAQEADLKFFILDGKNMENIEKALKGESFDGTVVQN